MRYVASSPTSPGQLRRSKVRAPTSVAARRRLRTAQLAERCNCMGGDYRGGPPPETSPCPSPSHRPGEGNAVEAVLLVAGVIGLIRRIGRISPIGRILSRLPIGTTAPARSPSPGRREGDGTGARAQVSGRRSPP